MDRHFRRFLLLFASALSAPFLDAQMSGPVTPGPLTVEWLCGPGGEASFGFLFL